MSSEKHPDPAACYRVRIRDLVLRVSVGVHAHERLAPQRLRIWLELDVDYPAGGFPDGQYSKVLCYETLLTTIRTMTSGEHFILVETLAERIADHALEDLRVRSARVGVEKLDIFDDCAGVGTVIERFRLDRS